MLLPGQEVVDLHEIKSLGAPQLQGLGGLGARGGAVLDPDFLGRKERLLLTEFPQRMTNDSTRRAIHGGAVDHASALLKEGFENFSAFVAQEIVAADIEGLPGAHANGWDLLT